MTTATQGGGALPNRTHVTDFPAPLNVTNAEFCDAIFCDLAPDEALWTCTFAAEPAPDAPWKGYAIRDVATVPQRPRSNAYVCVSSLKADNQGKIARRLDNFSRLHVVVLDDTLPPANLPPTWVLETSRPDGASKTQVGYRLATPLADRERARQLHQALTAAGHIGNDKSGNNPVRYVRLAVGSNTKHKPPHPHRLLHFDPASAVTLEELVSALGLDLAPAPRQPGQATHKPPAAAPSGQGGAAGGFFAAVKTAALGNLAAWVPELLPAARAYHDGYRVSSRDLGRDLEEDLSILPVGIRDFGTEETKTAVDLVLEHGPATTAAEAALWLCQRLGLDPAAIGWRQPPPAAPPPWDQDIPAQNQQASQGNTFQGGDSHVYKLGPTVSVVSNQELSLSKPSRNPLATLSPGALVYTNKNQERFRVIDSQAAEIIAAALRGTLAWDAEAASWLIWMETHWQPLTTAAPADKLLADAVHIGTAELGYRLAYLTGITAIITRRGLLPPPTWPAGVAPFTNGLLDLETQELRVASPAYALDWCLPHAWDPTADCPTIKAWLSAAVEHDQETVQLLRAWLAALIRGIQLQNFLVLLGRGGSGKGTYQRLAMALVGTANAAISTLRDLEENRFECAKLYGKRLAMVNEAGHHGGALNMLKAITGGDHLPLERKHVQQTGTFQFHGLVLMATNEQLTSTDATSGLERRRITVRFPRSATPAERADWQARGGEQGVLHREIPGLIRWLLDMPVSEIHDRISNPPTRVTADNLLGMAAGNSVADWLMECTIPGRSNGKAEDPFALQIGTRKEARESGALVFQHANEWAYASYLTWCDASARKPVSLVRFGTIVIDMAETLGHQVHRAQHPLHRTYYLFGLRLRRQYEAAHDWVGSAQSSHDPNRETSAPNTRGYETVPRGQVIDSREARHREGKTYSDFPEPPW